MYPTGSFFSSKGSTSGLVRNAGGSPIFGAHVVIVDATGRPVTSTITDTDGFYQVFGLEPGNYAAYAEPLDQPLTPSAEPSLARIYPGASPTANFTTRFGAISAASTSLTITKTAGDNQKENIGKVLPVPLEVQVRDSAGNPAAGVSVLFMATGGGGTVVPIRAITDAEGKAGTNAYLGTGAVQTFRASVRTATVTFTATLP